MARKTSIAREPGANMIVAQQTKSILADDVGMREPTKTSHSPTGRASMCELRIMGT